ncbi:MAG: type II toxin-antitoxin system HicA family toxin [Thermoplasmatota archaeon]
MGRLPVTTGARMVRFLEGLGFQVVRAKGSHVRMAHADGRVTTVPIHARKELPVGTLHAILRDVELERDEFVRQWNS